MSETPERPPAGYWRLPLSLLTVLAAVCVATVWSPPAGRVSWLLEVGPGLALVLAMLLSYRRFPLSHMVYLCTFLHILVLVYGGYYTYALTPLGNWARDAFELSRNHYDRVGHIALGFFPTFLARELLLRRTPLGRGGWLFFLVSCMIMAVAAFWELLEWWVALLAAPEVGQAFLGTQGDVWDAQWDMFLALVGVLVAQTLFAGLHDRSLRALGRR